MKKALASLMVVVALCGCATGAGNPPQFESGRSFSGERFQTETLTPGVGSALFPDPAWR